VLGQAVVLAGAGTTLGLALTLAGTRTLRAVLFEVSPTDPLTLGAAAAVLLLVSALACSIPARRATRVDPLAVLRAE